MHAVCGLLPKSGTQTSWLFRELNIEEVTWCHTWDWVTRRLSLLPRALHACPPSLFGPFFLPWIIRSGRNEWPCRELLYGETHMMRNWGCILAVSKGRSAPSSHMCAADSLVPRKSSDGCKHHPQRNSNLMSDPEPESLIWASPGFLTQGEVSAAEFWNHLLSSSQSLICMNAFLVCSSKSVRDVNIPIS